jgi:hypothetical protein
MRAWRLAACAAAWAATPSIPLACGSPSATGAATPDSGVDVSGAAGDAADAGSFRIALSVSPFTGTLFDAGAVYSDGKRLASDAPALQQLYVAHGANEVFVRIATELSPPAGSASDHSYAHALSTAALARSLALPLNPELGLWADYGDVSCQPPPDFSGYPDVTVPGPWNTLSIDQMVPVLRAYGTKMAHALLDAGTKVRVWDVGNEVDFGTAGVAPQGINCSAWVAPDGVDPAIGKQTVVALLGMAEADRAAWLAAHVWPGEARLLSAVADGVRAVDPGARFATHVSQSTDTAFAQAFYGAMAAGGFEPDEVGFSYYPTASATPARAAAFRATVTALRAQLGRPVFLAEFAYPAGPIGTGAYSSWTNAIPAYPITPQGQAQVLHDLASWGIASGLSGIRYWAPEVFVSGWGGFALFAAPSGGPAVANTAIDSITTGIASPDPAAFHD